MKPLLLLLSLFVLAAFAADPPEIPLWPNGAPGSENLSLKETVEQVASGRRVSNVTNPTMSSLRPANSSVPSGSRRPMSPIRYTRRPLGSGSMLNAARVFSSSRQ